MQHSKWRRKAFGNGTSTLNSSKLMGMNFGRFSQSGSVSNTISSSWKELKSFFWTKREIKTIWKTIAPSACILIFARCSQGIITNRLARLFWWTTTERATRLLKKLQHNEHFCSESEAHKRAQVTPVSPFRRLRGVYSFEFDAVLRAFVEDQLMGTTLK